jgi:hypothetical protein
MTKTDRTRLLVVIPFLIVSFIVVAWHPSYAQEPLQIRNVQVLNTDGNCICQHVFDLDTQTYKLAWQSAPVEGSCSVRIGDIDNDGVKEIVASVLYQTRTETIKVGKKFTTQTWSSFRIEIFENGAEYGGGPDWYYDIPGEVLNALPNDSYIADVDAFYPGKELVLIRSTELDVFHFPAQEAIPVQEHLCSYPSFLFSLEVGDADNDEQNEIVVVPGNSSSLRIWKRLVDGSWQQKVADSVPSSLWGKGMSYCGVTYMRIRNADNLGDVDKNEIIATGNNQRLMVWKYDGSEYRLTSWSDEMTGTMAYGIDSGDLDGNGFNEVVISLWGAKKYPARLVVLTYEDPNWVVKNSYDSYYINQRDLRMGVDGDMSALPAIALNTGTNSAGLKVLKFIGDPLNGGTFIEVYTAPGSGSGKLEIR